MGEAAQKLPNRSVVAALWRKGAEVKEKTSSIAGEFGERVRAQGENGGMHIPAFRKSQSIYNKSTKNEIAALNEISHLRVYLDWLEEDIRGKGHVGDIAELAKEGPKGSQPASNVMPLDEARKAFEKTADKAPKTRKGKKADAEPETAKEQLQETVAQGDAHMGAGPDPEGRPRPHG